MRTLLLLALLFSLELNAAPVMFYQPLNQDAELSISQWQQLWVATHEAGVETLIVQWTRHDDSEFANEDGWLIPALRQANQAGLELVLGLHYRPDYYSVIHQADDDRLKFAWHRWLAEALSRYRRLREVSDLSVHGWYLPLELDDRTYASRQAQIELVAQLQSFVGHLDAPLHLSSYSNASLTPRTHAQWLERLSAVAQVWWQDGMGAGVLDEEILQAYRKALPCDIGIVHEAFSRDSGLHESFSASPREPQSSAGCNPAALFSLRYMPWSSKILRLP
ncbi:DUF4434 domain-containing protein [Halopseudomonas salegens]|uniref:DUF4434 domain-containing protein n=1 Tax=Halopseudomonas salegens TaxID=1434072 RepID=A0A1H2E5Y4_9GAMM|nr:DUF4434 domain-containing protein [Halopseudomonas salegens]SDT90490.1 protein of unknown function [Halopseudomonas salegens]